MNAAAIVEQAANAVPFDASAARDAFAALLDGAFDAGQAGAFLTLLAQRGETSIEIAAAAGALRERMTPFEHGFPAAIDTCGTGGDGLSTFNLSTSAAIVAAAAGARVVKHGNRAASSRCGSADLLEAAGVELSLRPRDAQLVLEEIGITFLFAPAFHPALAALAPVRRTLGRRTIFNLIGPLANPGRVKRQLIGIPAAKWGETFRAVLETLGHERALVIHGAGGADEITLAGASQVWALGLNFPSSLDPRTLGLAHAPITQLAGGGPDLNLRLLHEVLAAQDSPLTDAVLVNTAAALCVAGVAADMPAGLQQARDAVQSGAARRTLARWVELSRQLRGAA